MKLALISAVAMISLSLSPAASATMAECAEQYQAITAERNDIIRLDASIQSLQEQEILAAEAARNAEQDINFSQDLATVERLRADHDKIIAELKDLALERDLRSKSVNEKAISFNEQCVSSD